MKKIGKFIGLIKNSWVLIKIYVKFVVVMVMLKLKDI